MQLTVANVNVSNTIQTSSLTVNGLNVVNDITLYPTGGFGGLQVNTSQITIAGSLFQSTVNSTAISVPQLILGGVGLGGGLPLGAIVNTQIITANGTWTNPISNTSLGLTGDETVLIMMWAGGGGATRTTNPYYMGGGGGACFIGTGKLSDFSTPSCAVTVGPGGASSNSPGTAGTGGNTVFVINSSSTFTVCGGGGARTAGTSGWAGTGGGLYSNGVDNSAGGGGDPLGGTNSGGQSPTFGASTFGGGGGPGAANVAAGNSVFGGGGGGRTFTGVMQGGGSIYGGAGGGGATTVPTSNFGGNGANNTQAATTPGGGGTTQFNGARGEVRVWVIR
jgi:hypothetical protein